jgi:hypothetical protein
MATLAQPRIQAIRSSKPEVKISVAKAEEDFLAKVMVSVSASLEAMSEEEQERAVTAAERAVAHLQS